MKKPVLPFIFLCFLTWSCSDNQEQNTPFSELPSIPDNIEHRELYQKVYEEIKKEIPLKNKIKIPAYPNAVVFSITKQDEEKKILPGITIMTSDNPEKVKEFYKNELNNWNYDKKYKVFYKDEAKQFPFRKLNSIPHITIHKIDDAYPGKKLMPDAKCYINIVYKPEEK